MTAAAHIPADHAAAELTRARRLQQIAEASGDAEDRCNARAALIRALTSFSAQHGNSAAPFAGEGGE